MVCGSDPGTAAWKTLALVRDSLPGVRHPCGPLAPARRSHTKPPVFNHDEPDLMLTRKLSCLIVRPSIAPSIVSSRTRFPPREGGRSVIDRPRGQPKPPSPPSRLRLIQCDCGP